jgi:hypothetical protein
MTLMHAQVHQLLAQLSNSPLKTQKLDRVHYPLIHNRWQVLYLLELCDMCV